MKKRGFTLMEVLVAVAILAVLTLMLTRVSTATSAAIKRGKDRVRTDEAARLILGRFSSDLRQALIRPDTPFQLTRTDTANSLQLITPGGRRLSGNSALDLLPLEYRADRQIWLTGADHIAASKDKIEHLIQICSYRLSGTNHFPQTEVELTEPPNSTKTDAIVLTFMELRINAKTAFDPTLETPQFVDLIIGLISSREMAAAQRIRCRSETDADAYIAAHERIYMRRVKRPRITPTAATSTTPLYNPDPTLRPL